MAAIDPTLIERIRQKIRDKEYYVKIAHCEEHTVPEEFLIGDGVNVILNGTPLKDYSDRGRVLFCGKVHQLKLKIRFRGRWIHTIVEHHEDRKNAVVTMYRPTVKDWRSEKRRRW